MFNGEAVYCAIRSISALPYGIWHSHMVKKKGRSPSGAGPFVRCGHHRKLVPSFQENPIVTEFLPLLQGEEDGRSFVPQPKSPPRSAATRTYFSGLRPGSVEHGEENALLF